MLIKCLAGYFQALVDVVVEFMDKSVPGWRRNVDPKDIPTGWI